MEAVLTARSVFEEVGRGRLSTCGRRGRDEGDDQRGRGSVEVIGRWPGWSCNVTRRLGVRGIGWRWTLGEELTGEELVGARGYGGASSLLSVQLGANRGEMEAGLCPGR